MKRIVCITLLMLIGVCSFAQEFSKPTNTETLKEQTMMFKQDFGEDKSIALILWGQSTGLGAVLELVDMTESPKPTELEMQYEINSANSLYLLVKGERFQFVVFRNDVAYIYSAEDEELWMKIPRTL